MGQVGSATALRLRNRSLPPLRSISAPAATTRAPASSTTRMASCVDPPVVHTSSRREHVGPEPARTRAAASSCRWHRAPQEWQRPPLGGPRSGRARATSCPIMSPHSRRDDRLNLAIQKKAAASACPQLSAKPRILQDKRALDVRSAVQPAGHSKMPMPDGAAVSNSLAILRVSAFSPANRWQLLGVEMSAAQPPPSALSRKRALLDCFASRGRRGAAPDGNWTVPAGGRKALRFQS